MRSRQAEHYRRTTLASIRAAIPADVPLVVEPRPAPVGGFDVRTLTGVVVCSGRAEVVRAFLAGYTAALADTAPEHTRAILHATFRAYQAGENADAKHWRERAEKAEAAAARPVRPVDDGREP